MRSLIQRHVKFTGSKLARALLADWSSTQAAFVKVFPHEYKAALANAAAAKVAPGLSN